MSLFFNILFSPPLKVTPPHPLQLYPKYASSELVISVGPVAVSVLHYNSGFVNITKYTKRTKKRNRSRIKWRMHEIQHRLVKGEKDKDIMRTVMLSERNYYKYKKKISLRLEQIQKELIVQSG
jgi:hypothetical protein